jgi:hypothetical protein
MKDRKRPRHSMTYRLFPALKVDKPLEVTEILFTDILAQDWVFSGYSASCVTIHLIIVFFAPWRLCARNIFLCGNVKAPLPAGKKKPALRRAENAFRRRRSL